MSEKQNSYCINILSSILNQDIIDVFPCEKHHLSSSSTTSTSTTTTTNTIQTQKKDKNTPELLCISKSSLFFIDLNIKNIKRFFTFDNINHITIESSDIQIFTLKTAIKSKKKLTYKFTITSLNLFLKLFQKQTTLYFIQITNELKEIPIETKNNEKYDLHNRDNNALPFKISDDFELKEKNASEYTYELKKKQNNKNETSIKIKLLENEPIEKLAFNPNISNFYFCSWNSLCSDLMYEKNQSCLLNINSETEDTIEYKLRICSSERNGKNILYCYNRKKYLWPFLETYKDYIIIYEEKYNQAYEQIDFDKKTYDKYLQLKHSFTFRDDKHINDVVEELLKLKVESYLIGANNLNYLTPKLKHKQNQKPLQSFIFLYDIQYKITSIYNKYSNKTNLIELNKILSDIKQLYASSGKEFNKELYQKTMKYKTFNDILEEKYNEIKSQFTNIKDISNIVHTWKQKINNYLEYIFKYPFNNNTSLFDYIVQLTQKNTKSKGEIYPIFRTCVNMNAITVNYDIIENPEIYNIINNINNIQQLTYNNYFLCMFIRDGSLKDIFNIESDLMYFKFLNYLLSSYNTNLNYDLISAIHDYIFTITKPYLPNNQINNNTNNNTPNVLNYYKVTTTQIEKYSNIFINNLIHIFTRNEPNTLMKVISLKCIIYLSYVDNISNLQNILCDEIYDSILKALTSFDSNLVYYSLIFISNISRIHSECLNLLSKYSSIIIKSINIIKGNIIPGCVYPLRIVIQALYVLRDLLKVNHIKDFLLDTSQRTFVKYLFNLINKNDYCNYEVYYLVFEILSMVVDKKMDMKIYIDNNFNCFECINYKCLDCLELIANNDNDKQVYEFIGKLLEFVVNYVNIDLNIAKSLRNDCKNLYLLCIALNDNKDILNEYNKLKETVERVITIFELSYNMFTDNLNVLEDK